MESEKKAEAATVDLKKEQEARDSLRFITLENSMNTYIEADLKDVSPEKFFDEMKNIAAQNAEKLWMQEKIKKIKNRCHECR